MSIQTTYDNMRDELRNKLVECLELSREMLNENIWGYDELSKDYALNIYSAIKKVKDEV